MSDEVRPLPDAIDDLADMIPYGHLKASVHPSEFLDEIRDLILDLRAELRERAEAHQVMWSPPCLDCLKPLPVATGEPVPGGFWRCDDCAELHRGGISPC